MNPISTTALFVATALAEIVGCYRPWLWLKDRAPVWVLRPATLSLAGMAIIMLAPRT
ncbi:hypothetical protein [Methyloversatilis sp. XJ19-13]|uniref:hypothetical protein n=1 Tax=Methyloversatilis sp. XJ19-13 TaxID=2963430 RepID=UPI003593746C